MSNSDTSVRARKAASLPAAAASAPKLLPKDNPESIYYEPPGYVKKIEPPPSPTLITLQVRARDQFLAKGRVCKGQAAGFTWTGLKAHQLGILSLDEDLPMAWMTLDHGAEARGELTVIDISFDPEQCAAERGAGTRIVRMSATFAEKMNGDLCDGLGRALTSQSAEEFGDYIDSIMERRVKAAEPPIIDMGDGTFREPGLLSFQFIEVEKVKGRKALQFKRSVALDAPALPYYEGRAHGARMAKEMVEFMKAHKRRTPNVRKMLVEALSGGDRCDYTDAAARGNTIDGFMEVIEALVVVGARHCNVAWIDQKIAISAASATQGAALRAEKKVAFVERMAAARAVKKAAAKGGAA